jgi:hypothetical protein
VKRCEDCVYCVAIKRDHNDAPKFLDRHNRLLRPDEWYSGWQCRRNPPQFYTTQESGCTIVTHKRAWPWVQPEEWCGEFRSLLDAE